MVTAVLPPPIIAISFLCAIVILFNLIDTENETDADSIQTPFVSKTEIKRDKYYYESDYDKEESAKIYEQLSEEDRNLQTHTSMHVGYRILTEEQKNALKEIQGSGFSGFFDFKEMEAIGETDLGERLTVNDIEYIRNLAKEARDWYEVLDGLESKQKYPDYIYSTNTSVNAEYWLEGKEGEYTLYIVCTPSGKMRMVLVPEIDGENEILIDYNDLSTD